MWMRAKSSHSRRHGNYYFGQIRCFTAYLQCRRRHPTYHWNHHCETLERSFSKKVHSEARNSLGCHRNPSDPELTDPACNIPSRAFIEIFSTLLSLGLSICRHMSTVKTEFRILQYWSAVRKISVFQRTSGQICQVPSLLAVLRFATTRTLTGGTHLLDASSRSHLTRVKCIGF